MVDDMDAWEKYFREKEIPISPAGAGRMERFRFISSIRMGTTSSCARR